VFFQAENVQKSSVAGASPPDLIGGDYTAPIDPLAGFRGGDPRENWWEKEIGDGKELEYGREGMKRGKGYGLGLSPQTEIPGYITMQERTDNEALMM